MVPAPSDTASMRMLARRRQIRHDLELPVREEYSAFLLALTKSAPVE